MDITATILNNPEYKRLLKLNENHDEAHDLSHFLRVKKYCFDIARLEGGDLEILGAAAMLHDIARGLEATGKTQDHLMDGATISERVLNDIGFDATKIGLVSYAVSVHQRRMGVEPKTLESRILQDADLLDTYGLIYVARSILWGVQSEKYRRPLFVDRHIEDFVSERDKNLSTIHYLMYRVKSPKYQPQSLNTKTGQMMAESGFEKMRQFIQDFIKEWTNRKGFVL